MGFDRDNYNADKASNLLDNLAAIVGFSRKRQPQTAAQDAPLEYLFEEEGSSAGPSWGARICYGTGLTYLFGLSAGALWGLTDGLRSPLGQGSRRLRTNAILNACTARGPFVANNLAGLALVYNLAHGGYLKSTGDGQSLGSSVGAAAAAGTLFRIAAGPRQMLLSGGLCAILMALYQKALVCRD